MERVKRLRRGAVTLVFALVLSACTTLGLPTPSLSQASLTSTPAPPEPPPHPAELKPSNSTVAAIWRAALDRNGQRILVSLDEKRLWLMNGNDVLFTAPIAIGTGETFRWGERSWTFNTPRGERRVRGKQTDPLWVPPDWHYLQKAASRGLEPVWMQRDRKYELSDGTHLEIRGDDVGRVNHYGNFWPWTPGTEMIFDGKIFIPPIGTEQRRVPDVLGTHRIDLGDAYLIHGTYEEYSIGTRASAGCIRLFNHDVEKLYGMVSVGNPVFIF
jgi:hypothetical protein